MKLRRRLWVGAVAACLVASVFAQDIDPRVLAQAQKLEAAFERGDLTPAQLEGPFFQITSDLYAKQQLKPALAYLIAKARARGVLGEFAAAPDEKIVEMIYPTLVAEITSRGLAEHPEYRFRGWDEISAKLIAALDAQGVSPGQGVSSPAFLTQMKQLTGAPFVKGNQVRVMTDAHAAFETRLRAIREAKESILIMSWAIYGDDTGLAIAQALIERKQASPSIDIKVMVDGQVAGRAYPEAVQKLEQAGIPLIRWTSLTNPFYGLHRKVMLVDHAIGFAGGRNFGNTYFERGPEPNWRDTDISFAGPAVQAAEAKFFADWNRQVQAQGKPAAWKGSAQGERRKLGTTAVAYVNQSPNTEARDPILLGTLKAIRAAAKRIDIANAYVVTNPALQSELLAARKRGVRVRIFTNSIQSVDEPIVTYPILASLKPLLEAGCEIYLKQGAKQTLHSKYLIVDEAFLWVGSYNLHPRSSQYEGEVVFMMLDASVARTLLSDMERDLQSAKKVSTVADLEIPTSPAWPFITQFFFNQI